MLTSVAKELPSVKSTFFDHRVLKNWFQKKRIIANCLRYIKIFLCNRLKSPTHKLKLQQTAKFQNSGKITSEDLAEAKKVTVKRVQKKYWSSCFEEPHTEQAQYLIDRYGLVEQEGILRCVGRMENISGACQSNSPILLPSEDSITYLIIQDIHQRLFHAGVQFTLAELRRKWWIPQGRRLVKRIIKKCFLCRKLGR